MDRLNSLQTTGFDYKSIKHWLVAAAITGLFFLLAGQGLLDSKSTYHKIFYFTFIPAALFGLGKKGLSTALKTPIISIFIIFSLATILSTAINSSDEIPNLLKREAYTVALFITICFLAKSAIDLTIKTVLAAATVFLAISYYSFIPWIFSILSSKDLGDRFIGAGMLDNPLLSSHLYGFYSVLLGLIAIYQKEKNIRLAYGGMALLFFILTLATGSRTPLLALACTALWLPVISANKHAVKVLGGLAVAAVIAYLFYPELFVNRGFSYRPELWMSAIDQIKIYPVLGYGFGNNPDFFVESLQTSFREPHNIHLTVLYFTGATGFIFWTAMHLAALLSCIKNKNDKLFIIASCLLVYGIAAGMTEGGGLFPRPKEHWFITWIPLAFIAALQYRKDILK